MRLPSTFGPARRARGMTLPEMMVSVSVLSILLLGFIQAQIFGRRYDAAVQSKLGATDQSRIGLGLLIALRNLAESLRADRAARRTAPPPQELPDWAD